MAKFLVRLMSLVIITVCIISYNVVLSDRAEAESRAKAEYEAQLEKNGYERGSR